MRAGLGGIVIGTVVLTLGLVVSGGIAYVAARLQTQVDAGKVRLAAERTSQVLESRLDRYRTLLNAMAAFNRNMPQATQAQWRRFAYVVWPVPKITGEALLRLRPVDPSGVKAFYRRLHAQGAVRVFAAAGRYCVVDRVWPGGLYSQLAGFNGCAFTVGRQALQRATKQRGITIPTQTFLVRNHVEIPGLLFVRWVSAVGSWVALSVPLRGAFYIPQVRAGGMKWRIVAAGNARGGRERVLYTGMFQGPSPSFFVRRLGLARKVSSDLHLPRTPWRIQTQAWVNASPLAYGVFAGGLLMTLLLGAFFFALASTRHRALTLARRMTREVRKNRDLLASVTDNIHDGVYRGTPQEGLVYANKSLVRMFGLETEADMLAQSPGSFYADSAQREKLRDKLMHEDEYRDVECEYRRVDGTHFTGLNTARLLRDTNGDPEYYVGIITDITERREAERQARFVANYDQLTGLPNRVFFEVSAERVLMASGNRLAGVLLVNLDRFKNINDFHGHDTGDLALIELASRLQGGLGNEDLVARIGADEFAVLVSNHREASDIGEVAQRLLEVLIRPYKVLGLDLHLSASIGIAVFPQDGLDVNTLLGNAETAMYRAKDQGRGRVTFFEPGLNHAALRQLKLEKELRSAVANEELTLYFQPRIALADGRISGAEALARWASPSLGTISPEEFIPIAERSHLIDDLGLWALRAALAEWKIWNGLVKAPPSIGVNVSACQLRGRNFSDKALEALAHSNVAHSMLEIELTETQLLDLGLAQEEDLLTLKGNGIRLALDDFGTGYSNLAYLIRLNIDVVKIDRSFVQRMLLDKNVAALVRGIISLARDFGARVVAEGAEKEDELRVLHELGCDEIQGYLLARPMAAKDFRNFLSQIERDGPPAPFDRYTAAK